MNAIIPLITLLAELARQSLEISSLIKRAHSEGRGITDEELDAVRKLVSDSTNELDAAIARAKAEGR